MKLVVVCEVQVKTLFLYMLNAIMMHHNCAHHRKRIYEVDIESGRQMAAVNLYTCGTFDTIRAYTFTIHARIKHDAVSATYVNDCCVV